jgi:DNA-binding response OmpR family regulator
MVGRSRVFILDHDADILDLLKLAVESIGGCEVRAHLAQQPGALGAIKAFSPALVILDLLAADAPDLRLLDQLRADEVTSSTPVLALSTSEKVAEQSLASHNVQGTLTKPFELDELERTIRELLGKPKVAAPTPAEQAVPRALRECADILATSSREIILEWVSRAHAVEPFAHQQLRLRDAVDQLPMLLWGLTLALRSGGHMHLFDEGGAFRESAVEHARLRRRQGARLVDLVRANELLRDAIWRRLERRAPRHWRSRDVFLIGALVHLTLDEITAVAAEVYEAEV